MPDSTVAVSTSPASALIIAGPGRNERLLVLFTATTNIADAVTKVALPLLAVQITHSSALIAAVAVLLTLPWLVTALHVGVLVDRMNRRSLMIAAETARLLMIGGLLLAVLTDRVGLPLLYATALVLGIAEVVALLSAASVVPSAVPRTRWEAANARITGVESLSNGFVGAPIGGLLVTAGFALALGATGAMYLLGGVLLLLLAGSFGVRPTTERRAVHAEIREGLSFLWGQPLLRTMALLISVLAGAWAAWLALIPVYAVGGPLALDAQQYGMLLTCLGAGGVVGTVLVRRINRLIGRRWAMFVDIVGSFLLVAAPAVLPAVPGSAWAIAGAAFVAGVGGTTWTVNSRLIVQASVPNELLGRCTAASRLLAWGMAPVAAALGGALSQLFGYQVAFGLFAVLCAALVVPFWRVVTADAVAAVDAQLARAG